MFVLIIDYKFLAFANICLYAQNVPAIHRNLCTPNRPGPRPVFTERLVVNIRIDQRTTLNHLAKSLDMTLSDLVRWILDNGIDAVTTAWKETWNEPAT